MLNLISRKRPVDLDQRAGVRVIGGGARVLPAYETCIGGVGVLLVNAVVVEVIDGAEKFEIPDYSGLVSALAVVLSTSDFRLIGSEIRFLRKVLRLQQKEFAAFVGVSTESVSKWENDKQEIEYAKEKLVRMAVASCDQVVKFLPFDSNRTYEVFELSFSKRRNSIDPFCFERVLFREDDGGKRRVWEKAEELLTA